MGCYKKSNASLPFISGNVSVQFPSLGVLGGAVWGAISVDDPGVDAVLKAASETKGSGITALTPEQYAVIVKKKTPEQVNTVEIGLAASRFEDSQRVAVVAGGPSPEKLPVRIDEAPKPLASVAEIQKGEVAKPAPVFSPSSKRRGRR